MERILSEEENRYLTVKSTMFKCRECDETFAQPLVATISSGGNSRTYYACPRCLSKVSEAKKPQNTKNTEQTEFEKQRFKQPDKKEEDVNCKHFFGYLKERKKDSAIPDECLTCERMVECLIL